MRHYRSSTARPLSRRRPPCSSSRVLGTPASFWNNREQNYRAFLAEQSERERLQLYTDWAQQFPINNMIKLGWIMR